MGAFFGSNTPLIYLVTPDDPTNLNAVVSLPDPASIKIDPVRVDREVELYNKSIRYTPLGSRVRFSYVFFNVAQDKYSELLRIYHWRYPVLLVPHSDQSLIAYRVRLIQITPSYPLDRVLCIDIVTAVFETVDVVKIKDYDNILNVQEGYSIAVGDIAVPTGAELVNNGDFADWTADDPDDWTVNNEDGSNYVTNLDALAAPLGNAARIVSDNSGAIGIFQGAPPSSGNKYIFNIDILVVTSGQLQLLYAGAGSPLDIPAVVGRYSVTLDWSQTGFQIIRKAACDVTFSNVSIKAVSESVGLQLTSDEFLY